MAPASNVWLLPRPRALAALSAPALNERRAVLDSNDDGDLFSYVTCAYCGRCL